VQSLFYGISPALIAIIALAASKLAPLTDASDLRLWVISGLVGVVTATGTVALLFIAAGLFLLLAGRSPGLASMALARIADRIANSVGGRARRGGERGHMVSVLPVLPQTLGQCQIRRRPR
jgi:chromate transport protein ChrA